MDILKTIHANSTLGRQTNGVVFRVPERTFAWNSRKHAVQKEEEKKRNIDTW